MACPRFYRHTSRIGSNVQSAFLPRPSPCPGGAEPSCKYGRLLYQGQYPSCPPLWPCPFPAWLAQEFSQLGCPLAFRPSGIFLSEHGKERRRIIAFSWSHIQKGGLARLDQRHFGLIGRKDQTSCIVIACHRNYKARSWLATTLGNQTRLESKANAHRAVFQRLRGLPRALQHHPGRCSSQIIFSSVKSRDTKTGHENHWKDPSGRGCREPKSSLWFPGCS
jgi:hypothetical protein